MEKKYEICLRMSKKDLRTETHHIETIIDQIARSVNAGIDKAEDARRGLRYCASGRITAHERA